MEEEYQWHKITNQNIQESSVGLKTQEGSYGMGVWMVNKKQTKIISSFDGIGHLALSRALGDFNFKSNTQLTPDRQAVTGKFPLLFNFCWCLIDTLAEPDIIEHLLTDHDEFMVLACDGIWDCLSSQEVIDFIRYKLCEHKSLGPICEELMDFCLSETNNFSGIGCDNMTIIVVAFLRRRTPQEWYDWMASKPPPKMPNRKAVLIAPKQ